MRKSSVRALLWLLALLLLGGSSALGGETGERAQIRFQTVPVQSPVPPARADAAPPPSPPEPGGAPGGRAGRPGAHWGLIAGLGFGLLLLVIAADAAGAGHWLAGRLSSGTAAWRRARAWASHRWERGRERLADARDWVQRTGLPWAGYGLKVTGLFLAGFVFEAVSSLGMGVGDIALRLLGRDPDAISDYWFQAGRASGAKALEYWGYLEMLAGVTGKGAGTLASATGAGAIVGAPAVAVGAALVAVGGAHVHRGRVAYQRAVDAARRTGGHSVAKRPDLKLLKEEEIRELLGPQASEQNVRRLMRFQEYMAQKMGSNIAKRRVRALIDQKEGLGPVLESWVKQLSPDEVNRMLDLYSGRRQLLGAITEQRTARLIAQDPKNLILKVNPHTNGPGADIVYLDMRQQRLVIVEAKGSASGRTVSPRLRDIALRELVAQEFNIIELHRSGVISSAELRTLQSRLRLEEITVVISTGGTAGVSDAARQKVAESLRIPLSRVLVLPLDS